MAGARDNFLWCYHLHRFAWLLSFPLWGVWRGYAATCADLRIVADRLGYRASWQVSFLPITIYGPAQPWNAFPRGVKPLGWTICLGVNRSGHWWIRPFMENPTFTRVSLSNVRMIIAIMSILVEELCQAATGRVLVLEFLLLGTRGRLQLHLVTSGVKWRCFPRTRL
jgi:hypothetical protein